MTETIVPTANTIQPTKSPIIYTPIPTITPRPTLLPTLLPEDADNLIREMFRTNGNCKLPCWWGIVPGVSTWDQTRKFFDSFATVILGFPLEEGEKIAGQGGAIYSVNFPNPEDRSTRNIEVLFYVNDEGIIAIMGVPGIDKNIQAILEDYGVPTEIWVNFIGEWPGDYKDYSIALNYPGRGIAFTFWGWGTSVLHDGEKYLRMCSDEFGNRAGPWLWSPQMPILFEDVAALRLAPHYSTRYGRISDVTDMDEISFYDAFIAGLACFETPYSVWPINPPTLPP